MFASGKRRPEFLSERAILEELMGRADQSSAKNAKSPVMGLCWSFIGKDLVAGAGFEPAAFRL